MTIKLPDADQLIKNQHKLNDLGAAMSLVDAEIQKETRTANNKLLESVSHEIKRLGCKFHSDRYPAKCPSGEPSLTMPVRRRIDKRRAEVTDEHEAWLHGDDRAAGFIPYAPDDELAALWAENSERIVAEHVSIYPGTRPHRWWHYSTPRLPLGTFPGCYYDGRLREPRRRLGGIGTPASDVLSYVPTFRYVFLRWRPPC